MRLVLPARYTISVPSARASSLFPMQLDSSQNTNFLRPFAVNVFFQPKPVILAAWPSFTAAQNLSGLCFFILP